MTIGKDVSECPSDETVLWRYMSFTKYAALLETRSLHLPRADHFTDPYEGYVHHLRVADLEGKDALDAAYLFRVKSFVSCWHTFEYESEAMWNLYALNNEGVAIVTTVRNIARAFTNHHDSIKKEARTALSIYTATLGRVLYVDDRAPSSGEVDADDLIFLKRQAFSYESETRLVVFDGHSTATHFTLPIISVDKLIAAVVVSPRASDWFFSLIRDFSARRGLAKEKVKYSLLRGSPAWESIADRGKIAVRQYEEFRKPLLDLFPRPPPDKTSEQ